MQNNTETQLEQQLSSYDQSSLTIPVEAYSLSRLIIFINGIVESVVKNQVTKNLLAVKHYDYGRLLYSVMLRRKILPPFSRTLKLEAAGSSARSVLK